MSESDWLRSRKRPVRRVGAEAGKEDPCHGKTLLSTYGWETGRDGRFIAYSNGTVLDTRTNLMWAAKDNGSNINGRMLSLLRELSRGWLYRLADADTG